MRWDREDLRFEARPGFHMLCDFHEIERLREAGR